jgi:transketolase C-terminal domain/subunit
LRRTLQRSEHLSAKLQRFVFITYKPIFLHPETTRFKRSNQYIIMRQIAFREALREAMNEEMRRDDRVFLMGEEVAEYNGAYKVSQGMLAEFGPKRVIDTPIAELGFTAVGVGAAQSGLRPIVEYMTWNFAVLALDQILKHCI